MKKFSKIAVLALTLATFNVTGAQAQGTIKCTSPDSENVWTCSGEGANPALCTSALNAYLNSTSWSCSYSSTEGGSTHYFNVGGAVISAEPPLPLHTVHGSGNGSSKKR